jgi:hypothetical protein
VYFDRHSSKVSISEEEITKRKLKKKNKKRKSSSSSSSSSERNRRKKKRNKNISAPTPSPTPEVVPDPVEEVQAETIVSEGEISSPIVLPGFNLEPDTQCSTTPVSCCGSIVAMCIAISR